MSPDNQSEFIDKRYQAMKWTLEKPNEPGYYWYKSIKAKTSGINNQLVIVYVNSELCVPSLNTSKYEKPQSVGRFEGIWAGPIEEPDESKELDNLAAMMWEIF